MAKTPEKWMQDAVNPDHKGALRKKLGAKPGKPISEKKLEKATHSKDLTTKRQAVLAETFKKSRKK